MSSPAVNVNPRLAALVAGRRQPLAGPAAPLAHRGRRAAADDRRGVAARRDLEPGDLREGDPRLRRLRRAARASSPTRAPTAARSTARSSSATSRRPATSSARSTTQTDHVDGYVSLEVEPDLAFDTEGTITAGPRVLGARRPPEPDDQDPRHAARASPAIEQAIYEGININVTLLFSVERVRARSPRRTSAGWSAARTRARASTSTRSRRSSSRASTPRSTSAWTRSAATTTSRGSPAWPTRAPPTSSSSTSFESARMRARSARPSQRPLWASTGVKDPRYPDTLYVDGLVGPDTVNTMPLDTLLAAADHGEVPGDTARDRPERGPRSARRRRHRHGRRHRPAAARGRREVRHADGQALAGIESKREAIVTQRPTTFDVEPARRARAGRPPTHRAAPRDEDVARRIWQKDPTLWGGDASTPELADRLGWLTIAEHDAATSSTTSRRSPPRSAATA